MNTPNKSSTNPELRHVAEQLARLIEISITLNSTLKVSELLHFIICTASELLDCEAVSILLYDEKLDRLFFAAATGPDAKTLSKVPVPLEGSIAGIIFKENRPLIMDNVKNDPRHFNQIAQQLGLEIHSLLGVPMRIKDQTTGVLEALNKHTGLFTTADADLLSVVASQAAVAIHNAKLVEALREAYDELNAADQLKTNFLALASHELRTPLEIIIGYASFLQEESQGELSEHAQHVLNAALQMRSLVDAMTNLNMLRTKIITPRELVFPIQQVLYEAYKEIKPLADAKGQQVTLTLPEISLKTSGDADKLVTAFFNVIINAVRYTPEGGKIIIGAKTKEAEVFVWVQDNGIGISPEAIKNIFREFYQVEPHMTRHTGGLGIGLTIAHGLIEAHRGRIWVESEGPGKGTCFKIVLPLVKE